MHSTGDCLAGAPTVDQSLIILRTRVLPRWLDATGLPVSTVYLLNQGNILTTAMSGYPV